MPLGVDQGPYTLSSHDSGFCFLTSPSETKWVSDLLSFPVFLNEGRNACVISGGREVLLRDYTSKTVADTEVTLSLGVLGDRKFMVHGWKVPKDGARLRWHVLRIFTEMKLNPHGGCAHRWAFHGWARWQEFAKEIGLASSQMIKKDMSASLIEAGTSDDVGERRSMGTHALIACLARWSALPKCKGGLGSDDDKLKMAGLLDCLVGVAMSNGVRAWTLFMDNDSTWGPPKLPTGRHMIDIKAEDGKLEILPLATVRSSLVFGQAIVRAMTKAGVCIAGRVGVRHALQASLQEQTKQNRRPLMSFFKQLVWFVGTLCDELLFARFEQAGPGRHVTTTLAVGSETQRSRMLMKYFLSMRHEFQQPKVLHLALDGSTLLKKTTMVGLVALPSNVGMTFPPQARGRLFVWVVGEVYLAV